MKTYAGRVVYNRRTNYFRATDIFRIMTTFSNQVFEDPQRWRKKPWQIVDGFGVALRFVLWVLRQMMRSELSIEELTEALKHLIWTVFFIVFDLLESDVIEKLVDYALYLLKPRLFGRWVLLTIEDFDELLTKPEVYV